MQGMQSDIQFRIILIYQPDRFLFVTIVVDFDQSAESSDPMVDMHDIIPRMQILQLSQSDRFPPLPDAGSLQAVFMITIENLMFRINTNLFIRIRKSFMYYAFQPGKTDFVSFIFKNIPDTLDLHFIVRTDIQPVIVGLAGLQSLCQQIEMLVGRRLRFTGYVYRFSPEIHIRSPFHHMAIFEIIHQSFGRSDELFPGFGI